MTAHRLKLAGLLLFLGILGVVALALGTNKRVEVLLSAGNMLALGAVAFVLTALFSRIDAYLAATQAETAQAVTQIQAEVARRVVEIHEVLLETRADAKVRYEEAGRIFLEGKADNDAHLSEIHTVLQQSRADGELRYQEAERILLEGKADNDTQLAEFQKVLQQTRADADLRYQEAERIFLKGKADNEARLSELHKNLSYIVDLALAGAGDEASVPDGKVQLARVARDRQDRQRALVEFARVVEASRIRELYLAEIFPGIERVSVPTGAIYELTGHANKVDMLFVCVVAKHRASERIFEFGTYQGRTTYHLTFASDNAHVTTLNLPPEADPRYGPYIGRYFRGSDRQKRITQIYCDSKEFDPEPYRGQFDFVFVDGDHSYEMVRNDTEKAFVMLKPGGAIMWHDYAPKKLALARFFSEFTQQRPLFRIKRTCLLLHVDGVDPLTFQPNPLPESLEKEDLEANPWFLEELYHA